MPADERGIAGEALEEMRQAARETPLQVHCMMRGATCGLEADIRAALSEARACADHTRALVITLDALARIEGLPGAAMLDLRRQLSALCLHLRSHPDGRRKARKGKR